MYRNMLNLLTDNYNKDVDSNIGKLFKIIGDEIQECKECLERVKEWKDIDKSKGKTLDRIGDNVLEFRGDKDDEFYRDYVKVKIISNLSRGDIETLNTVADFLLKDEFLGFDETWKHPAYEDLAGLVGKIKLSLARIPSSLERVRAAGIKLYWEATAVDNLLKIKSRLQTGKSRFPLCNTIDTGTWWYQQNFGRVKSSILNLISEFKNSNFVYPETALIATSEKTYQEYLFAKQKTLLRELISNANIKIREFELIKANEIDSGVYPYILVEGKLKDEILSLKQDLSLKDVDYQETGLITSSEELGLLYEFAVQSTIEKMLKSNIGLMVNDIDYKCVNEIVVDEYPEFMKQIKQLKRSLSENDTSKARNINYPSCNMIYAKGGDE